MAGEPGTTTEYVNPAYSTETNQAVAGGIQGMLGDNGYLNSVMGNWYNQQPGQGALGQLAQYDPSKAQEFMNPYTTNVVDEQARLSNQNLFENVLPGVNSTFAGNGQFGSTRNADFTNRAIRDQGYNLAGQMGQTLFNAQNQANTNYKDWTQLGANAGQQDFANWMQKANFPIGALTQMAQSSNAIESSTPMAIMGSQVAGADPTGWQRFASATGALNTAANDGTIAGGIDWLRSII